MSPSSFLIPRPSVRIISLLQNKLVRALSIVALSSSPALGTVVLGQVETFNGGTAGFGIGGVLAANGTMVVQGSGGVDGAGDGFLSITNPNFTQFATRIIGANTPFTGDFTAVGVDAVRFSLISLNSNNAVNLRVGFGIQNSNFWVSNLSFNPIFGSGFQEFEVGFDDFTEWTPVIGGGTEAGFQAALQNVNVFQFRHVDSAAPVIRAPGAVMGSVGIDNIVFVGVPEPTTSLLVALSGLVLLHRRRVA